MTTENNEDVLQAPFRAGGITITIVGVGLIGGSFALVAKQKGIAKHVIGVCNREETKQKVLQLKLVDEVLPLEEAIKKHRNI
jgi:prephenate dehydrogenase